MSTTKSIMKKDLMMSSGEREGLRGTGWMILRGMLQA
jgi:hypothetical protein